MISLLADAVSIPEGENRTISIHLNLAAEREVPVMLRVLLRSTFSSMCMLLLLILLSLATYKTGNILNR